MAANKTVTLLTNQTANGSSTPILASGTQFMTLFLGGTFDGATVSMECSHNNTVYLPVRNNAVWTVIGVDNFMANEGVWMRLVVTDVGASTSIDAYLN